MRLCGKTGCACVARFVCVCHRCEAKPDDRFASCESQGHAHDAARRHVVAFQRAPVWSVSPVDTFAGFAFRSHPTEAARA